MDQKFFYYSLQIPSLWSLLDSKFLAQIKEGSFYCLSNSIDSPEIENFAILPTGTLILNVSKDTYQQLGLEGTISPFSKKLGNQNYS